jgi:hypothetical protein
MSSQAFHEAEAKAAQAAGKAAADPEAAALHQRRWRLHFLAALHALLAQRWAEIAAAELAASQAPPPLPSRFIGVVQTVDYAALRQRALTSAAVAAVHRARLEQREQEVGEVDVALPTRPAAPANGNGRRQAAASK